MGCFQDTYISQWRTVISEGNKEMNARLTQLSAWRVSRLWYMEGKPHGILVYTLIKESELETRRLRQAKVWVRQLYQNSRGAQRSAHTWRKLHETNEGATWNTGRILKSHTEVVPAQPPVVKNPHNSWEWGEYSEVGLSRETITLINTVLFLLNKV